MRLSLNYIMDAVKSLFSKNSACLRERLSSALWEMFFTGCRRGKLVKSLHRMMKLNGIFGDLGKDAFAP